MNADDPRGQSDDAGILLLAGGKATRLPGKIFLEAGGAPLIVRVFRNLTCESPTREAVIACNRAQRAELAALFSVPLIVDRWTGGGPLSGMLTGLDAMRASRVFVAAADAPFIDERLIRSLCVAWQDGDECCVPQSPNGASWVLEPLAALYDRQAFLREGHAVLQRGGSAVHQVLERLQVRLLRHNDPRTFTNVNTPGDYAAFAQTLADAP